MKRREFERTTPEAVGLRSEDIEWLLDELENGGFTQMHGLMIMRHGKVCAEGWWAPYGPGVRHGLQSLSKTYAATAVGIACTEGLLHLDDKVIDIFPDEAPEKPSENLKKMTVRDVLCMGCGMDTMSPAGEHCGRMTSGSAAFWQRLCCMNRARLTCITPWVLRCWGLWFAK